MARTPQFKTEAEKDQRLKERRKAARIRNKDKIAEQAKRWRDKNTEKLREKNAERKSTAEYKAAKNKAAKRLRLLTAMYDAHVKAYSRHLEKQIKAAQKAAQKAEKAANPPPPTPKEKARLFFLGIGMKLCGSCKTLHGLDQFCKDRTKNNGYTSRCKACDVQYKMNARKNCALKRLKHGLGARISAVLRRNGLKKNSRTHEILGCDFEQLKTHIIKQFTKGMKWELIGNAIHIDHNVPLASATTEAEILALNHFTNLRPMWAADNLKKSDKREFLI